MDKTRYTVKVDGQVVELGAYGTYSAAAHAMKSLERTTASKVVVISGNGERVSYTNVRVEDEELSRISYEGKD